MAIDSGKLKLDINMPQIYDVSDNQEKDEQKNSNEKSEEKPGSEAVVKPTRSSIFDCFKKRKAAQPK